MWKNINLRFRIYLVLIILVFITFMGGLVMIWYTYRIDGLLRHIIDKNLKSFQVVEALEKALVNQKGFVTYYFLDKDPKWLNELGIYRQVFREKLEQAKSMVDIHEQEIIINKIEKEYNNYIREKDQVIEYYSLDEHQKGAELHRKVRVHFSRTLELCEEYKDLYTNEIRKIREESLRQAARLRIIAGGAIMCAVFLAFILAFTLIKQVLEPVRKLALEAVRKTTPSESGNEVKALSLGVRDLIKDMDDAQIELEKSRETLIQSEKMAVVGRLAASVAHSIRNPLTSVKMRLFSLNRTLKMSSTQEEDFEVISEEISHIDTIVQNFLEFSRPPKLMIMKVSPSEVVDMALQLLNHRLESYDVSIELEREARLPSIHVDPEQLKEVFVNLIMNACESMGNQGIIRISEYEDFEDNLGKIVVIKFADNGHGIQESIGDKIFQPFFTTKQDGTGLGLSIATRIIENHGGTLEFSSGEEWGATFIIKLPAME